MSEYREKPYRPGTTAVWAAEEETFWQGATQAPIVRSAAFAYSDLDHWEAVAKEQADGHIYGRNTNPTSDILEQKVALLEGAEHATSFSTGMAAISGVLFALTRPGDRVVSVKDTYGGTNKILDQHLPAWGVAVDLVNTDSEDEILRALEKGCAMLYLETPTNPTLKVLDIAKLSAAAKANGAVVVVDNTVATPINQNPLTLGADIVIHSATKFLGGHSDALGGLAVGSRELVERAFRWREIHGAMVDPTSAFLLLRGLKTLELRVTRHNENAMKVARFLERHEAVVSVNYPGLESHRSHAIAKQQMRGFGGLLSFAVKQDYEGVRTVLNRLKLARRAAHLGAVETVAGPPRVTSHVELTAEERQKAGIPEGLIRYSVGIENAEDLVADLDQALSPLVA